MRIKLSESLAGNQISSEIGLAGTDENVPGCWNLHFTRNS